MLPRYLTGNLDVRPEVTIVWTDDNSLNGERLQLFFEHVTFPLLVDARQTAAAVKLWKAVAESDAATRMVPARLCRPEGPRR
jgi:hypothetical protein